MKIYHYAIGCAALLPTLAMASDLPSHSKAHPPAVMAPAPSAENIFYIEGDLGFVNSFDINTIAYSGTAYGITYTDAKAKLHYDPAFAYGAEIGLGKIMGSSFRVGLGYEGFNARLNKLTGSGTFTYNSTTYSLSQSFSRDQLASVGLVFDNQVNLYMANIYYDFDLTGDLHPFIGAGVGLADIQNARTSEVALNGSIGVQYDITKNIYTGLKIEEKWVNGPQDKLGLTYENIWATSAALNIGYKF